MWEDKGFSFTKMKKEQYLAAGTKELAKDSFYDKVEDDTSKEIKKQCDILVQDMLRKEEIPEKVAEFLMSGKSKLSKYYHLIKTHKIPTEVSDPSSWMEANGYPVRGIISCRGSPTERLGGFDDHFLQSCIRNLPSFMNDTKHALQLIEEINEKVDKNELSLDGVGLATLDLVQMYNNMTEEVGIRACQNYLEGKDSNGVDEDEDYVSSESILKALRICIQNNFFQFNGEIFHQKKGVGTGMKLAPPFACLGVGKVEEEFFSSGNDLLDVIVLWKRYIDVFMILRCSETNDKGEVSHDGVGLVALDREIMYSNMSA